MKKIKGLKKAAGEAKFIPEGYHLEARYNKRRKELEVLPELLSETWFYCSPLGGDEIKVNIFPGDNMESIRERISMGLWM